MGEVTIDGVVYEEYESREFCKDIGCKELPFLKEYKEKFSPNHPIYQHEKKTFCKQNCYYTGTEWLSWLIKKGYEPSEELDEAVCREKTALELYLWMQERGVRLLRKKRVEE